MFKRLLHHLSHWLPNDIVPHAPQQWCYEDSSWHSSSFDLAQGLEVIEHRGLSCAVFADTLPAFHPPRA